MKENNNLFLSDLDNSAILRENESLLSLLLKDHTTGKNIKWGTDSYINHGYSFRDDQEIKIDLITGWYEGFIRPRVDKDIDIQLERQRNRAEVFTPSWVIKLQVDAALKDMQELPLTEFIQTKWLEITCGEAPYMVNRYDMETGEVIPLKERSGFIDVKFKKLNEAIESEEEWLKLAVEIYKASYGYEYQGDSLLLARENLILTFIDNYFYMFEAFPKEKTLLEITKIISLNVFQMDGLTYEVPYSNGGLEESSTQLNLFEEVEVKENITPELATIKLWQENKLVEVKEMSEKEDKSMKFDVVIGNPPYQVADGGAQSSAKPVYHHFVDAGKKITSKYMSLIIPTRWYVGGKGLDEFRLNMLNDIHLKKLHDFLNPKEVFPNTNIRGGVCYFLWDADYDNTKGTQVISYKNGKVLSDVIRPMKIEGVDIFIRDPKAPKILTKVINSNFSSISENISSRKPFGFGTTFTNDSQFKSNKNDLKEPVICYGKGMKKGYIEKDIIDKNIDWIDAYKLYTPRANNIGTELNDDNLNTHVGSPNTICTESYLVIGTDLNLNENSVKNLSKYFSTKFVRYLHSLAKASQDATSKTYRFVPVQEFDKESDIDWATSISNIDKQLYIKYNISEDEVEHIEKNIKEME